MGGISNEQIEKAFRDINNPDLLDNFVGVFPSDYLNKFINHTAMISNSGKYPFIIANTDDSQKAGTHWWSILDIEPKTDIFFLDSYGLDGLKHFIIQDDKAIIDKILVGIDKMDRTDNKITLCKVKFDLGACKGLTEDEIDLLSDTARQFFYFVQSFGNKLKLRSFVNIWMVEDRLQDLKTSTCGVFQIYFYKNLFDPGENSKINGETRLTKKTIETLMNEILTLDDVENEFKINKVADDLNIEIL